MNEEKLEGTALPDSHHGPVDGRAEAAPAGTRVLASNKTPEYYCKLLDKLPVFLENADKAASALTLRPLQNGRKGKVLPRATIVWKMNDQAHRRVSVQIENCNENIEHQ